MDYMGSGLSHVVTLKDLWRDGVTLRGWNKQEGRILGLVIVLLSPLRDERVSLHDYITGPRATKTEPRMSIPDLVDSIIRLLS